MADATAKFEHIWHALMRVLGNDHRKQFQANKLIIADLDRRLKRR